MGWRTTLQPLGENLKRTLEGSIRNQEYPFLHKCDKLNLLLKLGSLDHAANKPVYR